MALPFPTLCMVTWQTSNVQRTKTLLEALFGWAFQARSEDYFIFEAPAGAWIGLTQTDVIQPGNAFVPHITVDDLAALVARARELGIPVSEEGAIPGVGRFADFHDPDGSLFTAIQFTKTT